MVTDFEFTKNMLSKSEYGAYYTTVDGTISVDGYSVDTNEIVLVKESNIEVRLVFCASDGSYITTIVEGVSS